jgi:hypothetical protein
MKIVEKSDSQRTPLKECFDWSRSLWTYLVWKVNFYISRHVAYFLSLQPGDVTCCNAIWRTFRILKSGMTDSEISCVVVTADVIGRLAKEQATRSISTSARIIGSVASSWDALHVLQATHRIFVPVCGNMRCGFSDQQKPKLVLRYAGRCASTFGIPQTNYLGTPDYLSCPHRYL